MPAETEARAEYSPKSRSTTSSFSELRGSSCKATATPSADAPRDQPIGSQVSRVTGMAPRATAAATLPAVSSGHLICTKCTSAGSLMPGSSIAACTASAVASTCAMRPICSGSKSAVCATPITSRFCVTPCLESLSAVIQRRV